MELLRLDRLYGDLGRTLASLQWPCLQSHVQFKVTILSAREIRVQTGQTLLTSMFIRWNVFPVESQDDRAQIKFTMYVHDSGGKATAVTLKFCPDHHRVYRDEVIPSMPFKYL